MCDFTPVQNPDRSNPPIGVDLLGKSGSCSQQFDKQDFSDRTQATINSLENRGGGRVQTRTQ